MIIILRRYDMQMKVIEIRDACTYIPVLAIRPSAFDKKGEIDPQVAAALGWCGYASTNDNPVILVKLSTTDATNDPYKWFDSRTMRIAHKYIRTNYETLKDFDIVDVEYILDERDAPKPSYYEERKAKQNGK
jgi:hypothetical protein